MRCMFVRKPCCQTCNPENNGGAEAEAALHMELYGLS